MGQGTIDLDYFVFNSSVQPNLDSLASGSAPDWGGTNVGAIAGGAAGGAVALILLALLVWWLLRRRRNRRAIYIGRLSPIELAQTEPKIHEFPAPPPAPQDTTERHGSFELSDSPITPLAAVSVIAGSTVQSPTSPVIASTPPAVLPPGWKTGGNLEQSAGGSTATEQSVLLLLEREEDMGPLSLLEDEGDHGTSTPGTLPPDYFQATGRSG